MTDLAILYNDVSDHPDDPSAIDVLTQLREINAAATRLGYTTAAIPCDLNLDDLRKKIQSVGPDLVVNLVESLGGTDRMMAAVPMLLDALQIPYTGSPTQAILRSGDKLAAKRAMLAAHIPTPGWFDRDCQQWQQSGDQTIDYPQRIIVKAVHEHASFAMDNDAVCDVGSAAEVLQTLQQREDRTGCEHLAEQFIAGREFNLSVLVVDGVPRVLSPAEIDFSELPSELPQIVGARAKWVEDSLEYQLTPRRFDFPQSDRPLLDRISHLAIECWQLFGMRGYGRVDFRVDTVGRPYVLEVNANPCLSCDAGFVAAATRSGIAYDQLIEIILGTVSRPRARKQTSDIKFKNQRPLSHVFDPSHS